MLYIIISIGIFIAIVTTKLSEYEDIDFTYIFASVLISTIWLPLLIVYYLIKIYSKLKDKE